MITCELFTTKHITIINFVSQTRLHNLQRTHKNKSKHIRKHIGELGSKKVSRERLFDHETKSVSSSPGLT